MQKWKLTWATPSIPRQVIILAIAGMAIALLVAMNPEQAFAIFQELLDDIRWVKYYQPKKPKPSKPRVNKGAVNKWQEGRYKKIAMAA